MSGVSIRSRAPSASSPLVRRVMRANTSRDTLPEKLLRSALHRSGLRFRKDICPVRGIRCKADIVFPRQMVCVFVDGCFWHGCSLHFGTPKTNSAWWAEKIAANVERDARQTELLSEHGWRVVRIWEHDLKGVRLGETVRKIASLVRPRPNTGSVRSPTAGRGPSPG